MSFGQHKLCKIVEFCSADGLIPSVGFEKRVTSRCRNVANILKSNTTKQLDDLRSELITVSEENLKQLALKSFF